MGWRDEYSKMEDYYLDEERFPSKYYEFDKYELSVDPDETIEEIDNYDHQKQLREIAKCTLSFTYFCRKYVKINHPTKGLLPFYLFKYQRRVIDEYENNRFNIIRKFRQGGLTTVTVIWALWKCMFREDQVIMVVSKSDREAIAAGEIVKRALDELPIWLKPTMDKNNDHQKLFTNTRCKLFFYTVEAARGRSFTYLIIDEAAFITNMETHWNGLYPTVATGGGSIVISTVNGVGNWYEETFNAALRNEEGNLWNVIDLKYIEHPLYDDKKWVAQTKAQLGIKGWKQEVEGDFLGSGETYIPPDVLTQLDEISKQFEPIRMLFPEYNNAFEAKIYQIQDGDNWIRGALHIWKEPIPGRDYIMGVDTAEGIGDEGDNSCFQIIDSETCEQVAEFYSNLVAPHIFTQIISKVGIFYNTALVVVENLGAGMTVLNKLENEVYYENIYHDVSGKTEKVGIKTTKANRPVILEALQSKILTKEIIIKSKRLVGELKHFVFNKQTKKAEAQKNYHDDAIMAFSLALFIRDKLNKSMPIGVEPTIEMSNEYKAQLYQEIRNEIERDAPAALVYPNSIQIANELEEDLSPATLFNLKRTNDAICKEFGW